jgi:hypothetical protein
MRHHHFGSFSGRVKSALGGVDEQETVSGMAEALQMFSGARAESRAVDVLLTTW